jgi:hypothetical protein
MNIIIDEKNWQSVLHLIEETEAALSRFEFLSNTGRKINRDDIQLPALRLAVMQARNVKWEYHDVSDSGGTTPTAKRSRRLAP